MAHFISVQGSPTSHRTGVFGWLCLVGMVCLAPSLPALAQGGGQSRSLPPLRGLGAVDAFGDANAGPKVSVTAHLRQAEGDSPPTLEVSVKLAPEWHIYSVTQPSGGPIRTTIELQPSSEFQLAGPFQPDKRPTIEMSPYFPVPEEKHHVAVTWSAPLQLAPGVALDRLTIAGKVDGQVCREGQCVPLSGLNTSFVARWDGSRRVASTEPVLAQSAPPDSVQSAVDQRVLLRNLALGLVAGFILNFMPCVLPVIGLKVMSFVQQAHGNRAEAFKLNVIYSLGVISVFLILAVLAAQLNLSWGEQFSYTSFKIALIVLVFAMALSFLGVWEIPIPGFIGSGRTGALATREGAIGAFAKGVFATILATPCSGPLMGPLFAYSLNKPPYVGYALFLSLGIGMSFPYLVIGAFPELARWIPKPGAWMDTFKQLMGFVLLFTVVFLFYTLGNHELFLPTLTLLVGVWFACWLVGRVPLTASLDRKLQSWVYGITFATVIGMLAFRFLSPSGSPLEWQPFSPERLASAQREGKTVMIDFTANWCLNCKVNQALALETRRVAQLVEEFDIVPMLADWTNRDSEQGQQVKQMLDTLGHGSIPLLAIYPAGSPTQPVLLADLLTESQVIEALRAAGPSRSMTATVSTSAPY